MTTFRAAVKADLARRLMFAASTEEARFYLNGVHLEVSAADPGKVFDDACPLKGFLVSTDGHKLGAFGLSASKPYTDGDTLAANVFGHCIIARCVLDAYKDAAKAAKGVLARGSDVAEKLWLVVCPAEKLAQYVVADYADQALKGGGTVVWSHVGLNAPFVDGTFPDWRRVIPPAINEAAYTSDNAPSFNGDQLESFAEALYGWGGARRPTALCVVPTNGAGAPAYVLSGEWPTFIGVLMPMRPNSAGPSHTLLDRVHALIGVPMRPKAKVQRAA